jgi:hypothetical protein
LGLFLIVNFDLADEMLYMMGDPVVSLTGAPGVGVTTSGEGNDEATMAVIMSLLEAEAELTEPNDLHWSLS